MRTLSEIKKEINNVHDDEEQLNSRANNLLKQEDIDSFELQSSANRIEHAISHNKSIDKELYDLLIEKQEIISSMKKRQIEFEDKLKYEVNQYKVKNIQKIELLEKELSASTKNRKEEEKADE